MLQSNFFIFFFLLVLIDCESIRIPLTYAFSSNFKDKYPIQLSFQQTQTFSPQQGDVLYLFNANISIQTQKEISSNFQKKVKIGLAEPSQFINAVSQYFKVDKNLIQFEKEEYLQLVINDLSFIQSRDIFQNIGSYTMKIQYNFGDSIYLQNQQVQLIDGDQIYFNEFLIRRVLNNMNQDNQIVFKFNQQNQTITLEGNLENFPKISFFKGQSLFKVNLDFLFQSKVIKYIPSPQNQANKLSKVGINLLSQFSKFQIQSNSIIFKRTSQLYMLYLFFGYFTIFCLFILIKNRADNQKTVQFVRNIVKWVFLKDRNARMDVLRTQLQ